MHSQGASENGSELCSGPGHTVSVTETQQKGISPYTGPEVSKYSELGLYQSYNLIGMNQVPA